MINDKLNKMNSFTRGWWMMIKNLGGEVGRIGFWGRWTSKFCDQGFKYYYIYDDLYNLLNKVKIC